MVKLIKEIYLTAFVIFLKIGGWGPQTNASAAVALLSLLELSFVSGIACWIDVNEKIKILTSSRKPLVVVAYFVLCAVNYYPIIIRGYGMIFDQEFQHFKKSKKTALVAGSLLVVLSIIAFFLYAGMAHRRYLGVHD